MNGSHAFEKGIAAGLTLVAALCSCSSSSQPAPPLPSLYFNTSALGPTGGVYDGPAVVERSIANELVLAFDPDPATGGTLPRHATIRELGPTLFPVGAKVWLKKDPAVPAATFFAPVAPESISVLTTKDGTLLLGAANASAASDLSAAGVISLDEKAKTTRPYADPCASGKIELTTFDVRGDATVAVSDGETRAVRIGGTDYEVGIVGRSVVAGSLNPSCSDYAPGSSFALSVRARDLAALVSTLEVGQPPACTLGDAVLADVSVGIYDVSSGTTYDGPAFYTKRADRTGFDCFQFSAQGLATSPGLAAPVIETCLPAGVFSEPAVGQEFWATIPSIGLAALRKANHGPLIAASVVTETSIGGASAAEISQLLGVDVALGPGCDYADYNQANGGGLAVYRLETVTLGAPAPVVVSSDEHAVVSISGGDYDVWVWESGFFGLIAR